MVLQCGAEVAPGKTDARGAFRFTVNKTGNCELRVVGADPLRRADALRLRSPAHRQRQFSRPQVAPCARRG
jgi:hypothetical protein